MATELHKWCTYVVHGKVSNVTVYLPNVPTEPTIKNEDDLEQSLIDTLQTNSLQNPLAGAFVFFLNSLKVKCDFPGNLFDELDSNVLLSVHKNLWSAGEFSSRFDTAMKNKSHFSLVLLCR